MTIHRSVIAVVLANNINLVTSFVTSIVASRMLPVADLGALAICVAIFSILEVPRNFGAPAFLVQVAGLAREHLRAASAVVWTSTALIVLGVGLALAVLTWLQAAPQLIALMSIMSLSFVISTLSVLSAALLQRELRFATLAAIRAPGAVLQAGSSIALIIAGEGVESLAWGLVFAKAFEAVAFAIYSPGLVFTPPGVAKLGELLRFGVRSTAGTIVGTLGFFSQDLIVGAVLGMAAAGFYARGNQIVSIYRNGFQAAIVPVAFASFSEAHRSLVPVDRAYLRALEYLSVVAWPAFVALALIADPLIPFVFGPNWTPSVPVAQILCIGGAVHVLSIFSGELLVATGNVGLVLKRELIIQPIRVVLVTAACLFDIRAVAVAVLATYTLSFVINQRAIGSCTGVTFSKVLGATRRSLAVTLAVGLATEAAVLLARAYRLQTSAELACSLLAAAATWLCFLHFCRHEFLSEVRGSFRQMRFAGRGAR